MRKFVARIASVAVVRPSLMRPRITYRFCTAQKESYEFKAETKKLLDIVAKSLYTDKDVFIRELLSNASDALEKQRFLASQQGKDISSDLQIKIDLDEQKRTITIEDTGVGMTKQEMIDNLGTIARSGSKQFLEQVGKEMNDKIIGQFGVGFYSAFIVGNTVEVVSKNERSDKAYIWASDGTGTFTINEAPNDFLGRGTRITIYLRPEMAEFSKKSEVLKTVQRYSNFITFPILINDERPNLIQAIWTRNKSEVTGEEYNKFYEYISNSKLAYKYKLHYSTDAPISIKALLYIPGTHMERYGVQFEDFDVHLYSKKVLIKKNCRELLPNFFRFVKGVVDCEDLPLNISRENYQDTSLIAKLKSIITKRIIKELEAESYKDSTSYLSWYNDFQQFIKEGVAMDEEHREALVKLLRYPTNQSDDLISIDQYINKLPSGQEHQIYYFLAPNKQQALSSPYMEPFLNSDIPILLTYNHIDEIVFKQINTYQKKTFINIESEHKEIERITQQADKEKEKKEPKEDESNVVPTAEIAPLCLWLKNELSPIIQQVQVSKRLKHSPAIVVSQISSGMRQVMQAMGQGDNEGLKNLTLEVNPSNQLIVQLNKTRKANRVLAQIAAKQILDNALLSAGLLRDSKQLIERVNILLNAVLSNDIPVDGLVKQAEASRPVVEAAQEKPPEELDLNTEIVIDEEGNPKVVRKPQRK